MNEETEGQRAILFRVRQELANLCRFQDALLEGQYRFLLERVDALLELTAT